MNKFLSMGISEELVNTLKANGISIPTPIQEQAIPLLMKGKDIIAQSQTGTGKTFAFVLPILEKIDPKQPFIQALIVTPTRELALQITSEIKKLTANLQGVNILAVYGGQDVESQLKKLKKDIHIVIGTPGRLLDHIRRETVDFSKAGFLVLDEADQMLHIGFLDEVEEIIKQTPKARQTLLFSATMPDEIRKLAERHMRKPENIQVEKTQAPLANIKQIAISTVDRAKQNDLIESLRLYRPYLGVIFCRTKRRVSKLYEALRAEGFNCDELHGDLSQAKREQVMKRFRDADIQFLIATDVASRGLDVEGVTHVFNYDMPLDTESYIHRIGRTGRAGQQGLAITFYSPNDRPMLDTIEKELDIRIDKKNMGNARKNASEESGEGDNLDENPTKSGRSRPGKNARNAARKKQERRSEGRGSERKSQGSRGGDRNSQGSRGFKGENRKGERNLNRDANPQAGNERSEYGRNAVSSERRERDRKDSFDRPSRDKRSKEGRPGRGDQANQSGRPGRGDQANQQGRPGRGDQARQTGGPGRGDQANQSGRPGREDRARQSGRPARGDQARQTGGPGREDQARQSGRPGRGDQAKQSGRPARGDQANQSGRSTRGDQARPQGNAKNQAGNKRAGTRKGTR